MQSFVRTLGIAVFALLVTAPEILAAEYNFINDPDFSQIAEESKQIPAIASCLLKGNEAVLLSKGLKCLAYRQGIEFLNKQFPSKPFDLDQKRDCPDNPKQSFDARRLDQDALQRLAKELRSTVGLPGIRILNAIFCKRLSLIGLDLPFSLVIDKSAFAHGVEVRNVHIKGDLSLDYDFVLDELRIIRSDITGSFFLERSFAVGLQAGNSTIQSSASLYESVLFGGAQIFNVTIARELSLRGSALSFLVIQFSKIGAALDLSHSEARCAYHVNKNSIGYLVARDAGFGTVNLLPSNTTGELSINYAWKQERFGSEVRRMLSLPEIQGIYQKPDQCVNVFHNSQRAQFFLFDNDVRSSLCVSGFRWLGPNSKDPYSIFSKFRNPENSDLDYLRTTVAINGNTIANNLILDVWPDNTETADIDNDVSPTLHRLEVIGVKAGALVVHFAQPHLDAHITTAVDGLLFDRLYDGTASCEYGGSQNTPGYDDLESLLIKDFAKQLQLPRADQSLKWLSLNTIGSTQPYTAFSTAFKNAGADATAILVERENQELCARATRWLPREITGRCGVEGAERDSDPATNVNQIQLTAQTSPDSAKEGWKQLGGTLKSIPTQLSDFALLAFQGALYFLADHGFRPGKVVWWATLTLLVFWLLFLWPLKVIAYAPKTGTTGPAASPAATPKLRPLGFLFLFDRLLPAYQIDAAHYEIESYFKRSALSKIANATTAPILVRRLIFFNVPVERVTEQGEIDRIESILRLLRILGVVFAVFLAAAVSSLVNH
jgi:hypothetical protein